MRRRLPTHPDEDVATFGDKTRQFPFLSENRSLLVSAEDHAVAAARWLYRRNRVGLIPPVKVFPGIETIAVSGFGILELGHGYFAEAERVILDLREAIASQRHAADRELPQAATEGDYYTIDIRQ